MKIILIASAAFVGGQALAYYGINLVDKLVDFVKGLFGKAKAEEQAVAGKIRKVL